MKKSLLSLLATLAGLQALAVQPMVVPWQLNTYGEGVFSRDGTVLVPQHGWLQAVDVHANAARWIVGEPPELIAISPDGRWLAYTRTLRVGSSEGNVIIRQMSNGAEVARLSIADQSAGLGFSEDGTRLLVAVKTRVVREFVFTTAWVATNREWSIPYDMASFALVADGTRFAVTGETEGTLTIWDAVTPADQPLASYSVLPRSDVVPPSPGSNEFLAGLDGYSHWLITMSGAPSAWTAQEIPVPDQWRLMGNLLLSDDGESIYGIYYRWGLGHIGLVAWNRQLTIRTAVMLDEGQVFPSWLARAGPGQLALYNRASEAGHGATVVRRSMSDLAISKHFFRPGPRIRISADGTRMVTSSQTRFTMWTLQSNGLPVGRWERPRQHSNSYTVNVANDGSTVEVYERFLNGPFDLRFRAPDGSQIGTDTVPRSDYVLAEVSPKPVPGLGYVAAVATPSEVRLYRMDSGRFIRAVANPYGLHAFAFSPDAEKIALLGSYRLVVRRVADGTVMAQADNTSYYGPIEWHPNGDRLLLPSMGSLFRFNGTSLALEFVFTYSVGGPGARWSPDARVLFGGRVEPGNFLDTWRTVASPMPFQAFPLGDYGYVPPLVHPTGRLLYFSHAIDQESTLLRVMTNPFAVSPPTSVTLTPARLRQVGSTATVRVQIEGVAPMGGTPVSLQSGNSLITVSPASVTIPQGQNVATFTARLARGATALTTVGFTARNAGGSRSASLTVEPLAAPAPLRITPASSTMRGPGTTMAVTVALRTSAFLGGDAVTLASSSPSVLSVVAPTTVTVPAGQASARFTVRLNRAVAANTPITLTATTTGGTARTTITVLPELPPRPVSVVPNPSSLVGIGVQSVVRVTLAAPAPLGGAAVTLTTSAPRLLGVVAPTTLTVPAGRATVDFRVRTLTRPTTNTAVTLTARTATGAATGTLTVRR